MSGKDNAKSIKMIATDLDGTLLREDKSISDYTRCIINKFRMGGIKFVFATGRGTASKVAPEELFDGRITNNGAIAMSGSEVIYNKLIPSQTARPVLTACSERGLRFVSQTGTVHYSNFAVSDIWSWITEFQIVDFANHDLDAEKLYTPDYLGENKGFIESLLPSDLYTVVTTDITGNIMQIMNKDATKGKAVLALANHWNILPSEIVTFGNDLNDIDMLTSVDLGVAVENAHDEVIAAAKYVCSSNEEDGLAKWLEENILN